MALKNVNFLNAQTALEALIIKLKIYVKFEKYVYNLCILYATVPTICYVLIIIFISMYAEVCQDRSRWESIVTTYPSGKQA